jgi:hypothetical protein
MENKSKQITNYNPQFTQILKDEILKNQLKKHKLISQTYNPDYRTEITS